MDPKYSRDSEILKLFYKSSVEKVAGGRSVAKLEGKIAVDDIVYPKGSERAGEIIVDAGGKITHDQAELICTSGLKAVEVMQEQKVPFIVNSLREDADESKRRTGRRPQPRRRPDPDLISGSAPAIRPALEQGRGRCSTRSSRTPTATGSARGSLPHQSQARPGACPRRR